MTGCRFSVSVVDKIEYICIIHYVLVCYLFFLSANIRSFKFHSPVAQLVEHVAVHEVWLVQTHLKLAAFRGNAEVTSGLSQEKPGYKNQVNPELAGLKSEGRASAETLHPPPEAKHIVFCMAKRKSDSSSN